MSTVRLRIGPADHGRRMTLEEFHAAEAQEGYRYELARGVLEVTEVPGDDHWQVVDNIHEAFSRYRRDHPGVIARIGHGSEVRYVIPVIESDRHPDVALALRNDPRDERGRLQASLAVEVVSPGRVARKRDYEDKKDDYLVLDVIQEYWIVDPKLRNVTVLSRQGQGPNTNWSERVFTGEHRIETARLPGFDVAVSAFWADLESETAEETEPE